MQTESISRSSFYLRLRSVLIWTMLFCLGIVLAAFTLTGGKAKQLAADRVETAAKVTKANNYWGSNTSATNSSRDRSVRKFDITFEFQTADGRTIEGQKHGPDASRDMIVGETLPVWYSAAKPDIFELAIGHQERNTSAWKILAVVFASIIGAFFVWWPLGEANKFLKIRDQGSPTTAIVIEPKKQDIEGGFAEHVHWQVDGKHQQRSYFTVAENDRPEIGQTINVFQLGDDSVWDGESGPQKSR